jgi:sigma-B regulation protein RsbU (phosphoserine phosphatase)
MEPLRQPRRGVTHHVLVALSPLLLLYALVSFLSLDRFPYFGMAQRLFEVVSVDPGGPAARAGFRTGDRILAVNGVPREETVRILRDHGTIRPGHVVSFTVQRGAERLDLSATAGSLPRVDRLRFLASTAVGICFLLVGLVVYVNRVDPVGTLFYLLSLFFAFVLVEPPATGDVRAQALIKLGRDASMLFLPPLFLRFVLLFPHEKRIPPFLPLLRPVRGARTWFLRFPLFAVSLLLFAVSALLTIRIYASGTSNLTVLGLFLLLASVYLFACFVAGVAAFIHSYARTAEPAVRRKLRGVLLGTTAALLPIGVYNLLRQLDPGLQFDWDPVLTLLLALLPISFAHAIVRYQLLDFELILKRSILYTLLTTSLALIYLVFVDLVSRVLRNRAGGSDIPATLLSLFLIAVLFSPVRDAIQQWVDRTFYREKYRHRKTLHEFSAALTTILDRETLLRLLVHRISSALPIPRVAVFLRDPKAPRLVLQAATGLGDVRPGGIAFSTTEGLGGLLRDRSGALAVERMGGARIGAIPEEERSRLGDLDAALLLPLVAGETMVGLITLGRKRSGELYSHEDRQLLKTLANQAALAIENSELHHNTIEKERMERELGLARDIQLGFLPNRPPELPEVEIAAVNSPCREIGGDYYDFLLTRPRGLGVAIGDAAGHGVPAALLMANLQAAFRVEALTHSSPAEVLSRVNACAFRQTQESHFVTFFYGLIDLHSGLLRYANAGHNPPLLIGADGSCCSLPESDLILGVEEKIVYREHAVTLAPGDCLLLYTDGVTDELNREEETFGVSRLRDMAVANRHLSADDLCRVILRDVTDFMGNELGDDVTLVAVRFR